LLTRRLLERGPNFAALLHENWEQPAIWVTASRTFLLENTGVDQLTSSEWALLALTLSTALLLGVLFRRRLNRWSRQHHWQDNFASRFSHSLTMTFTHYAPYLLTSAAAAVFCYFTTKGTQPTPFISVVAYGLPASFLLVSIIRLFLAPCAPAKLFLDVPKTVARVLAQRLILLVLLIFLGYLLFSTLLAQSLPDPALLLTRGVYAAVFILNLIWALWLLGRIPVLAKTLWLRLGLLLILLGALAAEALGYRSLSLAAVRAVMGTLLTLGLLVLLSRLFRELFDSLEDGKLSWQRRLYRALGVKANEPLPGLVWLRFITTTLLWIGAGYLLLRIWGLSEAALLEIRSYLVGGFDVGSLRVIPARLLLAIVIFALLFAFSIWFRGRLKRTWLTKIRMERGAREAMVTLSGYAGAAIALLVALAVAGLEFTNLAIIAGALSVGIGFGLQNIVNNFISGLILLFERPIRTGDWIVVGNTEGYVRRIRIRSTQIQTFDRADVIVPNSELISTQVTNWMLHDSRGRVRVAVGVAYGSDTEKVKAILLEVAAQHPNVITDGSSPKPKVLFRAFGDSSLDFELRCFIKEIDTRLSVISDLNFAIDAAFRKHGIEIPFPQRDLHVRDWPPEGGPAVLTKKREKKKK
jgi:small-conductance mechanosensitive channel